MLTHLRKLFAYDHWANREFLVMMRSCEPPSRSVQLLAHLLAAEKLWYERLTAQAQSLPVWPDFTLPQCENLSTQLGAEWQEYLQQMTTHQLENAVHYTNSRGESFNSRVEDILTHVAMHGVYHRGQIAADLRAGGLTPPYTDFIHAVRQSRLE